MASPCCTRACPISMRPPRRLDLSETAAAQGLGEKSLSRAAPR